LPFKIVHDLSCHPIDKTTIVTFKQCCPPYLNRCCRNVATQRNCIAIETHAYAFGIFQTALMPKIHYIYTISFPVTSP